MNNVGILAYGSLINEPGEEIHTAIAYCINNVETPFKVEFLRSSRCRDGAPTLVPAEENSNFGDYVKAKIFVLKEDISEKKASDILYRREIHKVGSNKEYRHPLKPGPNSVFICKYEYSQNLKVVLYTKIKGNIDNPTPKTLARLAIKSACSKASKPRRDGISYLIDAKRNGIKTPLMPEYEKEVLRQTNSKNLQEAWEVLTK